MEHINIVVSEESEWKGNVGAKNPRVNEGASLMRS